VLDQEQWEKHWSESHGIHQLGHCHCVAQVTTFYQNQRQGEGMHVQRIEEEI
jgi:hypothetical protein